MNDYGALARSYNPLDFAEKLRKTLISFYQNDAFNEFTKLQLHQEINDALMKHYDGEEIYKYKIAKYFLKKNYIAAFEVKVKNSRADFLVINGETKCFEIKSGIDTLKRVRSQISNYIRVFEYNTIIIDEKHLSTILKIIPDYYGIWIFKGNSREVVKEASFCPEIDPKVQIELLTKKEKANYFESVEIENILEEYRPDYINKLFKKALKERYSKRWNFLRENWEEIMPIDLQFFFNTNIKPDLIYVD